MNSRVDAGIMPTEEELLICRPARSALIKWVDTMHEASSSSGVSEQRSAPELGANPPLRRAELRMEDHRVVMNACGHYRLRMPGRMLAQKGH